MSEAWIKVRYDLHRVRETIVIAGKLQISPYQVSGHLLAFWSWADAEIVEGAIYGCTNTEIVDSIAGWPGFGKALIEVGWLVIDPEKAFIPNWDRFLGAHAKKRALTAKRVVRHRSR